jgi:hypothetical protein
LRPVIAGAPVRIRDHSDLTFPARLVPQAVMSPALFAAWSRFSGDQASEWTPTVALTSLEPGDRFRGTGAGFPEFALQLRADTTAAAGTVFSSAPLDSERHVEYAVSIMEALAGA